MAVCMMTEDHAISELEAVALAKPTELSDEMLDSVAGGNFLGRTGVAILSNDHSLNGLGVYIGPGNGPPDAAVST